MLWITRSKNLKMARRMSLTACLLTVAYVLLALIVALAFYRFQ